MTHNPNHSNDAAMQAEKIAIFSIPNQNKNHTVNLAKILLDSGSNLNLITIDHALTKAATHFSTVPPICFKGAFEDNTNSYSSKHIVLNITFKTKNDNDVKLQNQRFHIVNHMTSGLILGMNSLRTNNIIIGSIIGQMRGDTIHELRNAVSRDLQDKAHQIHQIAHAKCDSTGVTYNLYNITNLTHRNGIMFVEHERKKDHFQIFHIQNSKCFTNIPVHKKEFFIQHDLYNNVTFQKCLSIKNTEQSISKKKQDIINSIEVDDDVPPEYKLKLQQLLRKYAGAISESSYDIGKNEKLKCRVNLTCKTPQPVKPINLPHSTIKIIREEIEKLCKADIIEEDPTIAVVTSYFLPIPKPQLSPDDKIEYRIVSNLKSANNIIEPENCSIPKIEQLLLKSANYKYISSIDVRKSFWSIELVEDQRKFFTIQCPQTLRLYKYKKLPMGSRTGSHCMQRCSNGLLLKNIDPNKVSSYIDDFLMVENTLDGQLNLIEQVLRNFEENGFKMNIKKCMFLQKEVPAFGYMIGRWGVRKDPKKIKAFKQLKFPSTKKGLQSALGMFNYYRRLCPNFASIATPLYNALSGTDSKTIIQTEEMTNSWNQLINQLTREITLSRPDYNKKFYLTSDACGYGVGGMLKQESENGKLDIILGCYSYKLRKNEISWENSHKELYAIFRCVVFFEHYLLGHPFIIITDSKIVFLTLKAKKNQIGFSGTLSPSFRFLMYLRSFSYEVQHSQGESPSFILSDLLSRSQINSDQRVLELGRNSRCSLLFVKDLLSGKMDELKEIRHEFQPVNSVQMVVALPQMTIWKIIQLGQLESKRVKDLCNQINNDENNEYKIADYVIDKQELKNVVLDKNDNILVPPHMISEVLRNIHRHGDSGATLLQKFNKLRLSMTRKYYNITNFIQAARNA